MQADAPPPAPLPVPIAVEAERVKLPEALPEPSFVGEAAKRLAVQPLLVARDPKTESFPHRHADVGFFASANSRISLAAPPTLPLGADASQSKFLAALPRPTFITETPGSPAAEPAPAAARPKAENFLDKTYAVVGVGAISMPEYEGAAKSRIGPAAGAIGKLGGIGFRLRGLNLTTDLIDDPPGSKVGFRFGPSIRYSANRHGKISDPAVAALGKLKGLVDAGLGAGINFKKLVSKYDSLSLGGGARWSLSGKRGGPTYSAGAGYTTPVSHTQLIGLHASAGFSSGRHARYNFSVSPAGSAASGLPAYRAKGGLMESSVGAYTGWSLKGDLRSRGAVIGVGAMYTRLHGSAARSPITSQRGSRNQWAFGAGVGYRI